MSNPGDKPQVRRLSKKHLDAGDPLGWFEPLYVEADGDPQAVPWARLQPNPYLVDWIGERDLSGVRAAVVGCGLGDDAAALARAGADVLGFDISPTAIGWAAKRFSELHIEWKAVDLFDVPAGWQRAFEFVFEALTVQALPPDLHADATRCIGELVAADGQVQVITRLVPDGTDRNGPPWALTESELEGFAAAGLTEARRDVFVEQERNPPVRRAVIEYLRADPSTSPNARP